MSGVGAANFSFFNCMESIVNGGKKIVTGDFETDREYITQANDAGYLRSCIDMSSTAWKVRLLSLSQAFFQLPFAGLELIAGSTLLILPLFILAEIVTAIVLVALGLVSPLALLFALVSIPFFLSLLKLPSTSAGAAFVIDSGYRACTSVPANLFGIVCPLAAAKYRDGGFMNRFEYTRTYSTE